MAWEYWRIFGSESIFASSAQMMRSQLSVPTILKKRGVRALLQQMPIMTITNHDLEDFYKRFA